MFASAAGLRGVTFWPPPAPRGLRFNHANQHNRSPQYPACSPYVVAVGGTKLYTNGNSYGSETAWGNGTSSGTAEGGGGGISGYESQPSYQSGVVSAFSTSKRVYPDVAPTPIRGRACQYTTQLGFRRFHAVAFGHIGGTSMACPLWAGWWRYRRPGAIDRRPAVVGRFQPDPAHTLQPAAGRFP